MEALSTLDWTAQFDVALSQISRLHGDKILLPPSALEQLLAAAPTITSDATPSSLRSPSFDPFNPYSYAAERHTRAQSQFTQKQLPHPLTFRLVNPLNNRVVYAGIQEFSAEEHTAGLSPFLLQALGLDASATSSQTNGSSVHINQSLASDLSGNGLELLSKTVPKITVHAKQLPKGTFVKLRPIEAGYDPDDWKALLEEHLRKNFTTLTRGELLRVPTGRNKTGETFEFEFLIDEFVPHGDGICVIDTDLEVDIEALNEEQARETLKRIAAKAQKSSKSKDGSSVGGELDLLRENAGQVVSGEYVDYHIPSWDRAQGVLIELSGSVEDLNELNLFVSPFSARQRHKPRDDEHIFANFEGSGPKRITISPNNTDLENAEAIWVSVHAPAIDDTATTRRYKIKAVPYDPEADTVADDHSETGGNDEVRCENCHQFVPQQSLVLHQNFCMRNNILCSRGCKQVFQQRSEKWQNHWHCPHDGSFGDSLASRSRHDNVFHKPYQCPDCSTIVTSLPQLAFHRTSVCPAKPILCVFCHLEVPQEGDPDVPNHEALFAGLTPHELADGARTSECHLCRKRIRLRDMSTHLQYHHLERLNREVPRLCRNMNCGRTLDGAGKNGDTRAAARMGQGAGNDVGLCSVCFGPLYVSMYDPEGRALKRRVERRYLSQLLSGCGKAWCDNEMCKAGRHHSGVEPAGLATKDALPIIRPFVDGLEGLSLPLHFCVDEASQRRRGLAQVLQADERNDPTRSGYDFPWCIASLEAEGNDLNMARDWLHNFAPQVGETR